MFGPVISKHEGLVKLTSFGTKGFLSDETKQGWRIPFISRMGL
jgi:hypothetical protein